VASCIRSRFKRAEGLKKINILIQLLRF
jgi:hypothetical protein